MDKLEEYLERARKERAMHERNGATGIVEAIDRIFPNLFNDEDERIRKELIDFIKDAKQSLELQERDNNKWQIEQFEMYIAWLEKQKSVEWSEEDNGSRYIAIELIKDADDCAGILDKERALKWLENLKPLPKQEWSEEDSAKMAALSRWLCSNNNSKFDGFRAFELVDWLKTLKPQNHWKPTEQQLYDMEYIMTHYPNIKGMVESIYNELKKL